MPLRRNTLIRVLDINAKLLNFDPDSLLYYPLSPASDNNLSLSLVLYIHKLEGRNKGEGY